MDWLNILIPIAISLLLIVTYFGTIMIVNGGIFHGLETLLDTAKIPENI